MTKRIKLSAILLIMMNAFIFAEDVSYKIKVNAKYIGTYIPSTFYEHFEATKNFEEAKNRPYKDYHDVLYIKKDCCLSNKKFHDGYQIIKEDFDKFSFVEKENGMYLIDNKGNLYKRISKESNENAFYKYVFDFLFSDITDLDYVMLTSNDMKIKIHNDEYELILDSLFLSGDDIAFYLRSDGYIYGVKLNGLGATFYYADTDEFGDSYKVTDRVKEEIKIFSYDPLITIRELSPSNLRLLRNLQYAKHGHTFKSEDLSELFSHYFWYIAVDEKNETSLTKSEERIVSEIRRAEWINSLE